MTPTIQLHNLIVHKVDHKNYDAPQLSDLESPISDDVASFLRQHIVTNREHRFTRSAAFIQPNVDGPNQDPPTDEALNAAAENPDALTDVVFNMQSACDELLGDPERFVPVSKQITGHLFTSMDNRTSPGDLVVCTFSEGDGDAPKWLALLKMDPQVGFVGDREEQNGQVRIVLRRVADVMPSGELQKCAFILPQATRQALGYDLRVLDQQSARFGASRLVASFFITKFLQCQIGLNRADKTQVFVYGSNEWIEGKRDSWPEEDVDRFIERVTLAVRDNVVNVTEFAPAVIVEPGQQEEYYAHLQSKGLDDLTFQPDPEERRRLTDYMTFVGDDGLLLRIKRDAVGEGKTLSYRREEGTNKVVVTISTTRWQEKVKRGR